MRNSGLEDAGVYTLTASSGPGCIGRAWRARRGGLVGTALARGLVALTVLAGIVLPAAGAHDTTVVLPADDRPCAAGGVCTVDGRRLSKGASVTVRRRVGTVGLTPADLVVDTNRDGTLDAADEPGEDAWSSASGAVFAANLDDDDGDAVRDGHDSVVNGSADVADMAPVVLRRMPGLNATHSVSLRMLEPPDGDWPRVFLQRDGGFELLLGDGRHEAALDVADLAAGDMQFYLESAYGRHIGFDGEVRLRASVSQGASTLSQDEVVLRGGPVIFSHPLQPAEQVYVVDTSDTGPLVGALRSNLAQDVDLYVIGDAMARGDRWVQDVMQTGYTQRPDGSGVASARVHAKVTPGSRGERFLNKGILASGGGYGEAGGYVFPLSTNLGGNIEVLPPHSHNGRTFPYGRLLIGEGMDARALQFLESQGPQAPALEVDVGWLFVGHVDEVLQVVPDRNAGADDRGWVVAIGSPELAIELLEQAELDGYGGAVVFANRAEETTVEAILADTVLMDFNEWLQTAIDAIRQVLIDEVGLDEGDFREVPAMWYGRERFAKSYFPSMQNLLAANGDLFLARPEGPQIDGVDIWQRAGNDVFTGLGYDVHFVDIYDSYYLKKGGVHCGINVEYAAAASAWWSTESASGVSP